MTIVFPDYIFQYIMLILVYLPCFYNGLFQSVKPELPRLLILTACRIIIIGAEYHDAERGIL